MTPDEPVVTLFLTPSEVALYQRENDSDNASHAKPYRALPLPAFNALVAERDALKLALMEVAHNSEINAVGARARQQIALLALREKEPQDAALKEDT